MKKLVLFSFINFFIFCSTFGQDVLFSVILNKGENICKTGNRSNHVLSGTSIRKNDKLIIVDSGYVALVHEVTGLSLELTSRGEYTVEEIENMVVQQPSSVLAKYGKFLLERLNPYDAGNQNLNATGAVERGKDGLIVVYWPSGASVYGNEALVVWEKSNDADEYVVRIKNRFEEQIAEYQVKGTSFLLELDNEKLKNENVMVVNVKAKGKDGLSSVDYGIQRVSNELRKSIEAEFNSIRHATNEESALNKLLIASFFEKNKLLIDAITFYNKALLISPDPPGAKKLYENFLSRNKLK